MARLGKLVLRIRAGENFLALVAYAEALREIAEAEPWSSAAETARLTLDAHPVRRIDAEVDNG